MLVEAAGVARLDRLGDRGVKRACREADSSPTSGVAHERVGEAKAVDRQLMDEPGTDRLLEPREAFGLGHAGRVRGDTQPELETDERRDLEQLLHRRGQPAHPAPHGRPDVGGQLTGRRAAHLTAHEAGEDSTDEERVSGGLFCDALGQQTPGGITGLRRVHEGDDIGVAQTMETDRRSRVVGCNSSIRFVNGSLTSGLVSRAVPITSRRGLRAAQHVGQQGDRGAIRPVGVVDDEHDRPRCRRRAQPRADGIEQAVLLRLGGRRDTRTEPGQTRPDLRCEAGQRLWIDAEGDRELIIVEGADVPSECLDHRLERSGHVLVAAPVQDERAGNVGRAATSVASRVFPMPGSPNTHNACACSTSVESAIAPCTSSSRPMKRMPPVVESSGGSGKLDAPGFDGALPSHGTCGQGLGQALELEHPDQLELVAAASAPSILTISEHRI